MSTAVCPNDDCPEREMLGHAAEYRPDVLTCPHCGAGLVVRAQEIAVEPAALRIAGPGAVADRSDGATVTAAETTHRHEAELVWSVLDGAGIPAAVVADDAGGAYAGLGALGGCRVVVPGARLDEALRLLEDEDPLGGNG